MGREHARSTRSPARSATPAPPSRPSCRPAAAGSARSPDTPSAQRQRVPAVPTRSDRLDFEDPAGLRASLEGVDTLVNTYWVRFPRAGTSFAEAVAHSRALLDAAADVGVRRVVHLSITHADPASPYPYFARQGPGRGTPQGPARRLRHPAPGDALRRPGGAPEQHRLAAAPLPVFAVGDRGELPDPRDPPGRPRATCAPTRPSRTPTSCVTPSVRSDPPSGSSWGSSARRSARGVWYWTCPGAHPPVRRRRRRTGA